MKKEQLELEMSELQARIDQAEDQLSKQQVQDTDDMDEYVKALSSTRMTPEAKYKLERKYQEMKKDLDKLTKMVNIAKPSLGSYSKFLPSQAAPAPAPAPKRPSSPPLSLKDKAPAKEDEPFQPEEEEEEEGKQDGQGQSSSLPPKQDSQAPAAAGLAPKRAPSIVPTISSIPKRKEEELHDHATPAATQPQPEKKRRVYGAMSKDRFDELTGGEDITDWAPPQNQSGDGRTNLNAKFGY